MEINYQETSNDLLTRIRIHETYGARNIDQWNTEVLKPSAGMKILDVGCGAGKQCFLYSDYTSGQADITGTDFSEELLGKAREKLAGRGDKNIKFDFMDFNKPFPYADNTFNLLSSAFAIYYASDLKFALTPQRRVGESRRPRGAAAPTTSKKESGCESASGSTCQKGSFDHPVSAPLGDGPEGHLVGKKCGNCGAVYLGPRVACSKCYATGPFSEIQLGDKGSVWVYSIVADDTLDDVVLERHETKAAVQDLLLEAMARGYQRKAA